MSVNYEDIAKKLKVISDPKRLKIIDMLSCDELCACEILEKFDISQPTLSHDMRKLEEAGLISSRREGKNTYYYLDKASLDEIEDSLKLIFHIQDDCICKE
ncbi:metalloregulator ArsR/SmtB family transcription factor [Anaerococcus sp.]|uniref:ArsR/SmtB family transcription factor n=1 Tax=Anaerococcus sp. TaxID=1872515 RepID=UPI0029028B84|nr:metalloregulator ArsR/SmtB family transcription factor [Anaerococcus sp.]MDU3212449.1 metalloregulator ArsR/SmtB family transcription factor [Anaerococcus sp.]